MGVRKASLLELDGVRIAGHGSEGGVYVDVLEELFELEGKDTGEDVRPVVGCVVGTQCGLNLWPTGVAGESNEEVRLPRYGHHRHGVKVTSV